jgi:hypothetical protein
MRALFGFLDHVPVDQQKAAAQRALFHREAMNKLGATDDVIRSWQCRNPHIARVCVALPWGGYLVARSPTISDRTHASNVQRAPSSEDESGAYAALCRFVYDCTLWCAPMSTAGMLEKYPGAGSRIGILIRDLGGGYSAQVGK